VSAAAPREERAALGLAPLGFLELDPPALVELAATAGFDAVSLRTSAAVPGGVAYPVPAGGALAARTRASLRAAGIEVLQVELVPLARDTDVRRYRPMLEDGAALGASRVVATGDDVEPRVVADRLAALCELAAECRMTVDLEFMRFRALATLGQALRVIELCGRPEVQVMIDALHLFRSGGQAHELRSVPAGRLGVCQLCDAPARPPPRDALAAEAREDRLLPGAGGLPLGALIDALPAGTRFAAEVPLSAPLGALPAIERARRIATAAQALLTACGRGTRDMI